MDKRQGQRDTDDGPELKHAPIGRAKVESGKDETPFAVRFEGYTFAGVVRYNAYVGGTGISGGVAEQRASEWAWFLRYPGGAPVGDGMAGSWESMICDIQRALAMEVQHGRLATPRRGGSP